jgi:hypothetical protein
MLRTFKQKANGLIICIILILVCYFVDKNSMKLIITTILLFTICFILFQIALYILNKQKESVIYLSDNRKINNTKNIDNVISNH